MDRTPTDALKALETVPGVLAAHEGRGVPGVEWVLNYPVLLSAAQHDPERYLNAIRDIVSALGGFRGRSARLFEFLTGVTGAIHEINEDLITEEYGHQFAVTLKVFIKAAASYFELTEDEMDNAFNGPHEDHHIAHEALEAIGKMSCVFMTTFAAAPKSRKLLLDDDVCMDRINLIRYPGTEKGNFGGDIMMMHQQLAMFADEPVIVIDSIKQIGYEVSVTGIAKNHFYEVLLRDALCREQLPIVDEPMNGVVPTPEQVAACNTEGGDEDGGSGWGMFHWTGLSGNATDGFSNNRSRVWPSFVGWGSMTPDDFPKFRGTRYVFTDGDHYCKADFTCGMIFPSIRSSVTPVRKLKKSEITDTLTAMTTCPEEEYRKALEYHSKRGNGFVREELDKICALRKRGWTDDN